GVARESDRNQLQTAEIGLAFRHCTIPQARGRDDPDRGPPFFPCPLNGDVEFSNGPHRVVVLCSPLLGPSIRHLPVGSTAPAARRRRRAPTHFRLRLTRGHGDRPMLDRVKWLDYVLTVHSMGDNWRPASGLYVFAGRDRAGCWL